jgi:hypothetical protein
MSEHPAEISQCGWPLEKSWIPDSLIGERARQSETILRNVTAWTKSFMMR